jgi:hypothetical protein
MMYEKGATSHIYYINNGSVPLIACSEFSLATYHDSAQACRGIDILGVMYDAQVKGFEAQKLYDAMFWTWKMPYGGTHENGWSLSKYYDSV